MEWSLVLLILTGHCCFLMAQLYDYHYIRQKKTWFGAQAYCRAKHTDLATVYDMRDMERLCDNKPTCTEGWIGLHAQENTNRTWHWSLPGVEYNETNWGQGEPDDLNGIEENYVGIDDNFLWYDLRENRNESFICYNETDPKKFIVVETKGVWLEAQKYCREHHTDLISGLDQLRDLKEDRTLSKKSWLIGLFRDRWRWSDRNDSSFRTWDELPQSNHCAATMGNRRWKSESCENKKHFYCYDDNVILITQNKTWDEALYYCRAHHYDLAYVTNKDEQRYVGQIARKANSPYVWMGLHYTCALQFWFWVTDEAVHYKNWASDKSKNHCDMSGAMERGGGNKWYKKPDENMYNFICSKK